MSQVRASAAPAQPDALPKMPSIWKMGCSYKASYAYLQANERANWGMFPNKGLFHNAIRTLRASVVADWVFYDLPLPKDFIRPHLVLPGELWSDLLSIQGEDFYSRELREAMALPEEAVQFFSIDLDTDSDELRRKDYRWMSWLNLERGVIDLDKSGRSDHETVRFSTREVFHDIGNGLSVFAREGFQPRFDLFRPLEDSSKICATLRMEQRIRTSGCVGVGFRDFEYRPGYIPRWLSDEDGLRINPPGLVGDLSPPAAVQKARGEYRSH